MIQHKDSRNLIGIEPCKIVFEEDTKYHTIHGVARLTKDEAVVSGDNFSFLELENGQDIFGVCRTVWVPVSMRVKRVRRS